MNKIKKYIIILVSVLTFSGLAFAAGTTINGLNQTVTTGDIVSATWYNKVNTMLNGSHTENGICVYNSNKIICANTTSTNYCITDGQIECVIN